MAYRKKKFVRRRRPVRRAAKRYTRRKRTHMRKRNPTRTKVSKVKGWGLSDALWQKFRYGERNYTFSLGTADDLMNFDLTINNPHDPYFSTGGKACANFVQAFSNYKFCRTYAVSFNMRISQWFVDQASSYQQPIVFGCILHSQYNADLGPITQDFLLAQPKNRVRIMKAFPTLVGNTRYLKFFINISDALYMTRQQYDAQLGGQFDVTNFGSIAGPTSKVFLRVFWFKDSSTIDPVAQGMIGDITLTYYTKMWCKQTIVAPGDDKELPEPTPEPFMEEFSDDNIINAEDFHSHDDKEDSME